MVKENHQVSLKTLHQFLFSGRAKPTPKNPNPKVYRARIFAINRVVAKSRFWTLMRSQKKIKQSNGELIACNEVAEILS